MRLLLFIIIIMRKEEELLSMGIIAMRNFDQIHDSPGSTHTDRWPLGQGQLHQPIGDCLDQRNSQHPLSALAQVLILVEDTNDNSPIFTSLPSEAIMVRENQEGGKVASFKASDKDSGAFGQVRVVKFTTSARFFILQT